MYTTGVVPFRVNGQDVIFTSIVYRWVFSIHLMFFSGHTRVSMYV